MKIGKYELSFSDQPVLLFDGFLHLNDHLGARKYLGCIEDHLSSGASILIVAEAAAFAGAVLHINRVSALYEFLRTSRSKRHTVFIVFDFLRYSDDHRITALFDPKYSKSRSKRWVASVFFNISKSSQYCRHQRVFLAYIFWKSYCVQPTKFGKVAYKAINGVPCGDLGVYTFLKGNQIWLFLTRPDA